MKKQTVTGALAIVCALCADYQRREAEIALGRLSRRTLMEYDYLDTRLFSAALSVTGDRREALLFIEEIGLRYGYVKSKITVGETTYKRYKKQIEEAMLRALHLAD